MLVSLKKALKGMLQKQGHAPKQPHILQKTQENKTVSSEAECF